MQRVWSYALSAYNHTTLIALQKKTQDWYYHCSGWRNRPSGRKWRLL